MMVEYLDDEAGCVAVVSAFLEQEGRGRGLVYVAEPSLWERLRAFIDISVPHRQSKTVARTANRTDAVNIVVNDRMVHMTRRLPESIDGSRCDLAVCYMGRLQADNKAAFARLTGVLGAQPDNPSIDSSCSTVNS